MFGLDGVTRRNLRETTNIAARRMVCLPVAGSAMKKALSNKRIVDFILVDQIVKNAIIVLTLTLAVPGCKEMFACK